MKVDSQFPGAGANELRIESDGSVAFAAPKETSPQSMWFRFRIRGARGQAVRCRWTRTNEVLGGGSLGRVVPVCRQGRTGPWRRVQARKCRFDPEKHEFTFTVRCDADVTQVAYCYPYARWELTQFLHTLRPDPRVQVLRLCESAEGRPVPLLRLADGAVQGPKRQVWAIARHHAGETPGSFVLEGFVREMLRRRTPLQQADFHLVPLIDVDHVERGCYGKNSRPRDYNRDYCLRPKRAEVAAVLDAVREGCAGRVDYFLDLHAPEPGGCSFLVPARRTLVSTDTWRRCWAFGEQLERLAPKGCPCRVEDSRMTSLNWAGTDYDMTSSGFCHRAFGALAMTLETSYHRDCRGRLLHPRDWRGLGHALAATLAEFLRQEPALPTRYPDPKLPTLEGWQWVHIPFNIDAHTEGRTLVLEGVDADSSAFVASEAIKPARGARFAFEYRLRGSVTGASATGKGVDRETGLPTGEMVTRPMDLPATRRWRRAYVPAAPHSSGQRLLLHLKGITGKLDVRFG